MVVQLVILSIVLAAIIGFFGRKRRFGFWGYFFVSILFTPVMGFLALMAAVPKKDPRLAKRRRSRIVT